MPEVPTFHGIALAKNGKFYNLTVEELTNSEIEAIPADRKIEGRLALASDSGEIKFVNSSGDFKKINRNEDSFRNLLHNGSFVINRREFSSQTINSSHSNSGFGVDRWQTDTSVTTDLGTVSIESITDLPGQAYSMRFESSGIAANTSFFGGESIFRQGIEGEAMAHLGWGTSNAKTVTLSFWAKSNVAGIYAVGLQSKYVNSTALQYRSTYEITDLDTWKRYEITIPGPTTLPDSFPTDANMGVQVGFSMMNAYAAQTGVNVWEQYTSNSTWYFDISDENGVKLTKQILEEPVGSYIELAGIQLEIGEEASEFEQRSLVVERDLTARYYQVLEAAFRGGVVSDQRYGCQVTYPVQMRASPTLTTINSYNSSYLSQRFTTSKTTRGVYVYWKATTTASDKYSWVHYGFNAEI